MRFVHSFGTKPAFINCYDVSGMRRLFGQVWFFALSAAYAKRSGADIVLHTDELGERLFSGIPYSEIFRTCDNIDLHPRFWAAPKFFALDKEDVGAVHIDGDVFIKKESLIRDIEESQWDVIVQCPEIREWACDYPYIFEGTDLTPYGININTPNGYNTGVVGFRNGKAKSEFINNYKAAARYLGELKTAILDAKPFCVPDLILEQQHLLQVCEREKCKVKALIDSNADNNGAAAIGYQHILSSTKFRLLGKVQQTLKKVDFQLYNKLNRLCPL